MAASCYICANASDNRSFIARERMYGSGEEFVYFECGRCRSLQIHPTPADLGRYYPPNYYSFGAPPLHGTARGLRQFLRSHRAEYILHRRDIIGYLVAMVGPDYFDYSWDWFRYAGVTPKSAILDVGCGQGALLRALQAQGFYNLTGADPFVQSGIRQPGFRIEKCEIQELAGRYDFIMFHDSLEHMVDPRKTLRAAASLCRPGACVMVTIPLADSVQWREYGDLWMPLDAPRHLLIPSLDGMVMLAGQAGFEVSRIKHDGGAFSFYGSELYRKGLPYYQADGSLTKDIAGMFSAAELKAFADRAEQLNARGQGDHACLHLRVRQN